MNVIALHGFLGRGEDWHEVESLVTGAYSWKKPSFFSKNSKVNLSDFSSLSEDLESQFDTKGAILIGYSMGARIALEWFQKDPNKWEHLVILAGHLGGLDNFEIEARQKQTDIWLDRFKNWAWKDVLSAWNSQPVLKDSRPAALEESEFDRNKLCQALENLSVANQSTDFALLREQRAKIHYFVGGRDSKYLHLYKGLQARGVISHLHVIEGLGHRILQDGAKELATQLEAIWNL